MVEMKDIIIRTPIAIVPDEAMATHTQKLEKRANSLLLENGSPERKVLIAKYQELDALGIPAVVRACFSSMACCFAIPRLLASWANRSRSLSVTRRLARSVLRVVILLVTVVFCSVLSVSRR
jgi:uncharacterized protein YqhQ